MNFANVNGFTYPLQRKLNYKEGSIKMYIQIRVRLIDPFPSIPDRIRLKLQNYVLIHRTIKYLVKSNDWGERYNSVVFFFYLGSNCGQ